MANLIDYILDLFRSESQAQAFVNSPDQALRAAGLGNVTPAQVQAVAATAAPSLALGNGDPIVGLQRAVAERHGIENSFLSPQTSFLSPQTNTELASRNNTEFASNNDTSLLSPNQDAGANAQQGAFNLGFGDITLGDKTTNTASGDGAVVVGGDNEGDIASGEGAVLGNNNDVNNGDILAGTGSNVAVGSGSEIEDNGTTSTGSGDVIQDNEGPVISDVDMSGGNGGGASSSGGGLLGIGNGGGSADGGSGGIVIVDNDTNAVNGDQTEVGGDFGSGNTTDSSTSSTVATSVETETNTDNDVTTVTDNSTDNSDNLETNLESNVASNNSSQNSADLF